MPSLLIDIEGRTSKLADALEQANKQIGAFKRNTESALSGIGKVTFGIIGAEAAMETFRKLGRVLSESFEKAKEDERSFNQLAAAIKATGNAAGITTKEIEELSKELSKKTVFDDEAIRNAATALSRFKKISGDTFREALTLIPDVAVALGKDLPSAAQAVGKALSDPTGGMRALKDAGVQLSEQQIDTAARLVEVGKAAEAQKIVLDALRRSVGGAAGAENQGLYGASKQLEKSWDDLLKTLGHRLFDQHAGDFDIAKQGLENLQRKVESFDLSWKNLVAGAVLPARFVVQMVFPETQKQDFLSKERRILRELENQTLEEQRAEEGARTQKAIDQAEEEAKQRKAITERQAADAEKFARVELQQRQFVLDAEQAANEGAYKQGLQSLQDYYDKQETVIERGLANQLEALGAQGTAAEAAFAASAKQNADILKLTARLQDVANQSDQARYEAGRKVIQITQQRTDTEQTEIDAILKVTAALYEQNGQLEQAAKLQQEVENRKLATRAAKGDQSAITQLETKTKIDERVNAQKRILELHNKDEVALRNLQSEEEKLQAARESGGITELEMLRRIDAARLVAVQGLKERAAAQRAEAARSGDVTGKLQADAEATDAAVVSLEASIGGVEKKFRDVGQGSMQQFFEDFASGTQSMKVLFDDLVRSIVAGISRIAAQNVSEQLFGKEGGLEKYVSMLAKLFSGSSSGGGYLASSSIPIEDRAMGGAYTFGGQEIKRFSMGGVVTSPRFFRAAMGIGLMGEAGPEAIMPLHRGADGKLGVRGGGGVDITMNIATPDVRSFAESKGQIAKKAARAIAGARRNM